MLTSWHARTKDAQNRHIAGGSVVARVRIEFEENAMTQDHHHPQL